MDDNKAKIEGRSEAAPVVRPLEDGQ